MFGRPKHSETEEDLLKQYEEFKKKQNEEKIQSLKYVRPGKRKPDTVENSIPVLEEEKVKTKDKPVSRFAETRAKKKKEGLVDHTILKEAVSREGEKTAVLTTIVPRNVPSLSPMMMHWNPIPSPEGFPKPPKLNLTADKSANCSENVSGQFCKRKSLYMRHMEKDASEAVTPVPQKSSFSLDENLKLLGKESVILDGESSLGKADTLQIHMENMSRLSEMTHEERLKEREELMSRLTPAQIAFLQSVRRKKELNLPSTPKDVGGDEASEPSGIVNVAVKVPVEEEQTKGDEKMATEEAEKDVKEDTSAVSGESEGKHVRFDVPLNELPIPPNEAKKWVHMDKVELDKLRWTTDLPPLKPLKGKEGYVARFNFQGDLLPYDADISWSEGLHHHGDEPERAGYTLDELFLFVRSQVLQQRHLGLKTLANIIRNSSEGLYDTCFETPIIQLMIDAGLVLLLRFAIDESTALVHQEALRALYFLVSSEPDERCLSIAEPWVPTGLHPGFSSYTHSREKVREELDAEEKELKDIEIIKLDVIRALVRMDVHIRLRYMLESKSLSAPDVIHVIGILKRISRHSLTAAWTVVKTPGLLSVITEQFLPHDTTQLLSGANVDRLTSVYGVPLSQALSLFKVLASRGRQIAVTLVDDYELVSRVMAYVSLEPTEVQMPLAEVLLLAQEAYGLWSIFLTYGLTKSQQGLATFYPLIVKQLIFYRDKVDLNDRIDSNQYNYEIGAHLVNVLTKGLCVAATKSLLTTRMKNNQPSVTGPGQKEAVLQLPILDWEGFDEIFSLIEVCLTKWMTQVNVCDVSFSGFKLLGSLCNFINVYISKWRDQSSFEGVVFSERLKFIVGKVLSPLLANSIYENLLFRAQEHSVLTSKFKLGKSRDAENLGSLWSVCEGGRIIPILQKDSPFPFFLPLTSLLRTSYTLCPSLEPKHVSVILNSNQFKRYLTNLCKSTHFLANQWFSRIEVHTVANLLQLASIKGCDDPVLFHRAGLTLIPLVHKGDEHIIKSLLTDVVCNKDFAGDLAEIENQIDRLTFKEHEPLKSPGLTQPVVATTALTKCLLDSLPAVGQDLVRNLLHSVLLEKSLLRHGCVPFLMNDLALDREEDVTVLDHYWCLMPLKLLRHLHETKKEVVTNHSKPETILCCRKWLQMTYFVLKHRPGVAAIHTTPMGWYRHLSNVFLASNDLFLDSNIISYTQAVLATILANEGFKRLDPSEKFPDLLSCNDWYKAMLDQYASVSYGDNTFAIFVIIPLLRSWPIDFRLFLFSDHVETLRFIRLTTADVSQFISLHNFLDPHEDDQNLVFKYRSAVGQRAVTEKATPFVYKFVSHHVSEFLKSKQQKS